VLSQELRDQNLPHPPQLPRAEEGGAAEVVAAAVNGDSLSLFLTKEDRCSGFRIKKEVWEFPGFSLVFWYCLPAQSEPILR
jgi:hypothetical protein